MIKLMNKIEITRLIHFKPYDEISNYLWDPLWRKLRNEFSNKIIDQTIAALRDPPNILRAQIMNQVEQTIGEHHDPK